MTDAPSRAIRLFGTDDPVAPSRILTAGRLTAELDAGNLRYIRFDGIEVICAVSFIVRDKNWGTYNPKISNLLVVEDEDGFLVSYDAVASDASQEFRYAALITGRPDGALRDFVAWRLRSAHWRRRGAVYATREQMACPKSRIRLRDLTAIATSVSRRASSRDFSVSPMTRL